MSQIAGRHQYVSIVGLHAAIEKLQCRSNPDAMDQLVTPATDPSAVFPAGFVGSLITSDFDEMAAAARGWDQHYTKLGRGSFRGEVVLAHTARFQLATAAWSCSVLAIGTVPKGARTFALITSHGGAPRHGGRPVRPEQLAIVNDRDELHFLTPGGCEMVVLSFPHELVEGATETLFGTSFLRSTVR